MIQATDEAAVQIGLFLATLGDGLLAALAGCNPQSQLHSSQDAADHTYEQQESAHIGAEIKYNIGPPSSLPQSCQS
jgi:hypothetical protein